MSRTLSHFLNSNTEELFISLLHDTQQKERNQMVSAEEKKWNGPTLIMDTVLYQFWMDLNHGGAVVKYTVEFF